MTESVVELITTTITFRFASGEVVSLDEDQIEKVPYLTALVSSANYFESTRDEDGHYKLDPHINYEHFSFVLESLSFHSIRQLFTRLPKQNNIIAIIALLDFLGLGPQSDPTLNEVDSVFFSTVVYSPLLEEYLQIVRPSVIQDMAVRFAVALAKEEYDLTEQKEIDQIYWFVMFILSAYDLFGPRFRHHVYKIGEHCFSLFKPSLLKPLNQLILRAEKEARKSVLTTHDFNISLDEENQPPMEQLIDVEYIDWSNWCLFTWRTFRLRPTLKERKELLLNRIYRKYPYSWYWSTFNTKEIFEPVYHRVLEIMYERLQRDICQRAISELHGRKNLSKFEQIRISLGITFDVVEREVLPKRIDDLFKSESIQEEIRERILEEICVLTPKIDRRRALLLEEIRLYEQWIETSHENEYEYYLYPIFLFDTSNFESIQEEALSLELVLGKSPQDSSIFKDIYQRVLGGLSQTALRQFNPFTAIRFFEENEFGIQIFMHVRPR